MIKYYIPISLIKDENIVCETLTRIGFVTNNIVYQTCHFIDIDNKQYLLHFKELFSLFSFKENGKIDKNKIHMSDDDVYRRNQIIYLLNEWNMIKMDNEVKNYINDYRKDVKINIVPFKDKNNFKFISKFEMGL